MKKILAILMSLLMMLCCAGCNNDEECEKLLTEAYVNYREARFEAAKADFEKVASIADSSKLKEKAQRALEDYDEKVANYKKSAPTFRDDYDYVMSSQWEGLYFASTMTDNFYTVTIYVNPLWHLLNENQKENFVDRALRMYSGMWGARMVYFDVDYLDLYVKDISTKKTVAKWGSIMGTSIKD